MDSHIHEELSKKRGVVGTGTGIKWENGVPTNEEAIIVFVNKKEPRNELLSKYSSDDMVPDEIDGIPTDVIEVGDIVMHACKDRVRPIRPGYSCGHGKITSGTIGGFFVDKDGDIVILSNNHVLANQNKAQAGDIIYQPGPYDCGGRAPAFNGWPHPIDQLPYFATLKRFVPLNKTGNNQDSAIAKIHPEIIEHAMIAPQYPIINKPMNGFSNPTVGQSVQKCGRTTNYTTGRVMALNATFTIGYDIGQISFSNCAVMSPLSQPGDSGSCVFDMNMNAVALLFAGSNKVTITTPIATVRNEYGLSIWKPDYKAERITINDNDFRMFSVGAKIERSDEVIKMSGPTEHFCYLEHDLVEFNSVQVTINSGVNRDDDWGPGIVIVWPNGIVKVNLQDKRFGGYFNDDQTPGLDCCSYFGNVKDNTDYILRIKRSNTIVDNVPCNVIIGEVCDNGNWYKVIEIPSSVVALPPICLRVGKTNILGGAGSSTNEVKLGECYFKDLTVD
ncbi:MAG: S1 family peptidase [Magnetococcus sp. WYHC-3]